MSQFKFLFVKTSYSRKKKKKTLEFNFPRKRVHTVKLFFLSLLGDHTYFSYFRIEFFMPNDFQATCNICIQLWKFKVRFQ